MRRYVIVNKAEKPKKPPASKKEPDWKKLHNIADNEAKNLQKKLVDGFEKSRNGVSRDRLASTIRDNKLEEIDELMNYKSYDDLYEPISSSTEKSIYLSMKSTGSSFKGTFDIGLDFDIKSNDIQSWIKNHSGNLIQNVTNQSKSVVRRALENALLERKDYGKIASQIYNSVGLNDRQAVALSNYEKMLSQKGFTGSKLDGFVEKYRDKLLKYRAETISRTEMLTATNRGQEFMWQRASDQGLIKTDKTFKVWIVTPDDRLCDYCAPLDGKKVPINENFSVESPSGLVSIPGPPLHVNCRCASGLEFKR